MEIRTEREQELRDSTVVELDQDTEWNQIQPLGFGLYPSGVPNYRETARSSRVSQILRAKSECAGQLAGNLCENRRLVTRPGTARLSDSRASIWSAAYVLRSS